MKPWELVFHETTRGRRSVVEYLDGLDGEEASKVRFDLQLLQEFGLALGVPHARSLRGKLWELRVAGRVQHRVLYFATSGRRLALLHAFTKKTPQTPRAEIETATRRMVDHLEREGR